MCEVQIDSLFVMWAIGGGFLGWVGMKSYKRYQSGKKDVETSKPDEGIDSISK